MQPSEAPSPKRMPARTGLRWLDPCAPWLAADPPACAAGPLALASPLPAASPSRPFLRCLMLCFCPLSFLAAAAIPEPDHKVPGSG